MVDNPFVRDVQFLKSAVKPSDFPEGTLPEIAVAGRSNVGKSSLINRLTNRRSLARVSNTPGRTQLLNFFEVNGAFTLCDLPGYGFAKVPLKIRQAWGPMVERYLEHRQQLRALLLLVDVRREPGDWERDLIGWCTHYGIAVVPVITKIDKVSVSRQKQTVMQVSKALGFSPKRGIGFSAKSGVGLEELWAAIKRYQKARSGPQAAEGAEDTPAPPSP
ncbi:ribosome biogenesis GTP-binding protein YihA/YsxC [Myxococcota bacterium]|nr:ribosome biogenesis GTP-binding protein YihA/YsxC [Myxococcota bacterium]MBU1430133.1 ribosome biogenesis GTP-binding protein YihA/YsxC [Myxococcota bacterium]MBU1896904.1 ribosome biogenesis GTP-binding protein YihA/YsxC [Myxococcota bacterium]